MSSASSGPAEKSASTPTRPDHADSGFVTSARDRWCTAAELNELLGSANPGADASTPLFVHRRIRAGQRLIHVGHPFDSLYVVNGGFFKTMYIDESGYEQVLGFPMKGDLIGTDGIGGRTHVNEVIALTAADVIVIPFNGLEALGRVQPGLDDILLRMISRQLVHEQLALTAIGALSAESRLARFLLRTGERMKSLGYSDREFILRMSRQDIGSYLGMKIETVSRTLTALVRKGLISIAQREVTLIDREGLDELHRRGPARPEATGRSNRAPARTPATSGLASTPWSGLTGDQDPLA